jgi:pimeloyl-ACP methyl ester carboxylesterase
MAEAIVRGARIHYERLGSFGNRARVVFVHGFIVDNLAGFYFTMAGAVAPFADTLLYDLRGHGQSERSPNGYRIADMAADLDELTRVVFGSEPMCLVGNSFGAIVAVEFARRFIDRLSGLVFIDGHLGGADFASTMVRTLSMRGTEAEQAIAESFRLWPGRTSERKTRKLAEQANALVMRTSLVADMGATRPLAREEFAAIDVPVLAIYGEQSDLLAGARGALEAMPRASLVVLPGCTHSVLWEAKEEVRARLVAFCRGLPEAAA